MKIKKILFLLLVVGLHGCNSVTGPVHFYPGQPQPENNTAHLRVPGPITVLKVDGKEIEIPSNEDEYYDIYLLPGVHRIDFKYEKAWGDNVSGMLIRSDAVGVESRFYAGKKYEFIYRKPSDLDEAYDTIMGSEFKAQLVEKGTGRTVASRSISELDEFRMAIVSSEKPVMPEKVKPVPPTETNIVSAPKDIDADTAAREDAVKRLKFWWLMANKEEKMQFKQWLKSIEGKE